LSRHAQRLAAPAIVLLAVACSSPSTTATTSRPSIDFGSGVSTTPGMPGMSATPSTSGGSASQPPSTPSSTPVPGSSVTIENFAFTPANITVAVGTTVTWTNRDEEPHNVVANDGSFHSPGLGTQGTYSYTFRNAGTFDYVCSIHPSMHGSVVVTP
jgi:plastocyanin